jgi:hypothetical protein
MLQENAKIKNINDLRSARCRVVRERKDDWIMRLQVLEISIDDPKIVPPIVLVSLQGVMVMPLAMID